MEQERPGTGRRGVPGSPWPLFLTIAFVLVSAAAIVGHTVALAHALGLRLVAEGVEDVTTGAALATLGCDIAQGYAIARPVPVGDFLSWLEEPRLPPGPVRPLDRGDAERIEAHSRPVSAPVRPRNGR